MKRAVLLLGYILLGSTFCFGKPSLKKQQYEFLNWYINNRPDKLKDLSNVLEHFDNFAFDEKRLAEFKLNDREHGEISSSDQRFLKEQILKNNHTENLDTTLIRYTNWKIKTKINQSTTNIAPINITPLTPLKQPSGTDMLFQKLELKLPATTISLPIFTKDGNIAFINRTYNCGPLCADGGIEIYTKIKGEWKFFGYLGQWIS